MYFGRFKLYLLQFYIIYIDTFIFLNKALFIDVGHCLSANLMPDNTWTDGF